MNLFHKAKKTRAHEKTGEQNQGPPTCLVIVANFSANSTSPFIKGILHPLPSNASTILITFGQHIKISIKTEKYYAHMSSFFTRMIRLYRA